MGDRRLDELVQDLQALRIQVARLEDEVRRHQLAPPEEPQAGFDHGFQVGDRVRILNRVRRPATWNATRRWSEAQALTATVTVVRSDQVFFVTDNGVSTWRAPNNIRRL